MIEISTILYKMTLSSTSVAQLVMGISDKQARWKPSPSTWSMLEVVHHLLDIEREDFRPRLDRALHHPTASLVEIDPSDWVLERAYNQADLQNVLEDYLEERHRSLQWLQELHAPNWEAVFTGSSGTLRAGDLLTAWMAHDFLHIRQLNELHYAYLQERMQPYQADYAGEW
ncbi:MAG: DinB family protein [Phototrophicaceae bacterium]